MIRMRRQGHLLSQSKEDAAGMDPRHDSYVSAPKVMLGLFALFAVPLSWPLAFIATWHLFPGVIDPLAVGLEPFLYILAIFWLLMANAGAILIAKMFRLRRTNLLWFSVAVGGTILLNLALTVAGIAEHLSMIGEPGVIRPASVSDVINLNALQSWVESLLFFGVVTSLTAGLFVLLGGVALIRAPTVHHSQ
ncbi:MAG: hypothetical protein LAT81_01640 [Oceanicaulis sp.]|nr:hypothetical protein [Oceanicaulis sp.]